MKIFDRQYHIIEHWMVYKTLQAALVSNLRCVDIHPLLYSVSDPYISEDTSSLIYEYQEHTHSRNRSELIKSETRDRWISDILIPRYKPLHWCKNGLYPTLDQYWENLVHLPCIYTVLSEWLPHQEIKSFPVEYISTNEEDNTNKS